MITPTLRSPPLCLLALAGAAIAQPAPPAEAPTPPPSPEIEKARAGTAPPTDAERAEWLFGTRPSAWTIEARPILWFAALGGDIRLGRGGTNVKAEDLRLDRPSVTPGGEFRFREGDLTFGISAFGYSHNNEASAAVAFNAGATAIPAGTRVRSEATVTSGELTGGYRVWGHDFRNDGEPLENAPDVSLRLDIYGGARFINPRVSIATAAATVEESTLLGQPLLGARLQLEMLEKTTLDFSIDYGIWPGDEREFRSVNVHVGFQWRPWGNVGFEFGWRGMFNRIKSSGIDLDGSLQGLTGAVIIRF